MARLLGAGAARVGSASAGPVGNDSGSSRRRGTQRPYRGRDRRSRTSVTSTRSGGSRAGSATLIVCAGSLPPIALLVARGAGISSVADFVAVFGGLVGVAAGVAAFVHWRIVGTARVGCLGVALIDLGVLSLVQTSMATVDPGSLADIGSMARLAIAMGAGWLMWQAVDAPEVDAGLSPVRSLWAAAGGTLFALGVLDFLAAHALIPAAISGGKGQDLAEVLTVVIWSGLVVAAIRSRSQGRGTTSWSVVVLGMLALSAAARFIGPSDLSILVAGVIMLVALGLALGSTANELQGVLSLQNGQQFQMHLDLDDVRRQMIAEREALEERLHDLRNTVGAIRTADRALRTYARQLEERDRGALTEALSTELNRLQALIEPLRAPVSRDLPLSDVLAPVIETERSYGADIRPSMGDTRARVNSDALIQIIQNLLVNARHYAPDSPVWIEAGECAGRVELRVIDHGPGISEREGLAIFARGVRGASSIGTEGDGLGLFLSARLMTEMGGSIRLRSTVGSGACFVLELPATGSHPTGSSTVEHPSTGSSTENQPSRGLPTAARGSRAGW
jgi:signal transduction histidine kinase